MILAKINLLDSITSLLANVQKESNMENLTKSTRIASELINHCNSLISDKTQITLDYLESERNYFNSLKLELNLTQLELIDKVLESIEIYGKKLKNY